MKRLFPSLIAADILNLEQTIKTLAPYCDGYHVDVMDNHFVPNLTMGPIFVNAIARIAPKPVWVHFMIEHADTFLDTYLLPPGSIVSFHFESKIKIQHIIKRIKEKKWRPSIAISPKISVEEIFPLLDEIDHVLLMSVEPGFSGQPFLASVLNKLDPLVAYRDTSKRSFTIAMDGGINKNNIAMLAQKGVDDFAVAAAIFDQKDYIQSLRDLRNLITTD